MGSANDRMVGGTHYKAKSGEEEHWDRVYRLYGPGYFVGNITKYVERYHKKDGVKDLEKAAHYVQKLIELETARPSFDLSRARPPADKLSTQLRDWAEKMEDEGGVAREAIEAVRKAAEELDTRDW